MAAKLIVESVGKRFDGFEALKDIKFEVQDREFLSIIGRSGCGKTTLLRIIAGLEHATSGRILLGKDGRLTEVTSAGPDRGMVFQEHFLFPWRTARENIEFGLEFKGLTHAQRRGIAMDYLRLMNLEPFGDRYPTELSGGMRQRVAIARALAIDPEVLLLDEPFAALDAQTRSFFQDELLRIWQVTGKTIVLVTHNIDEAVYLSDRIVVLMPNPGRLREVVLPDLSRPRARMSTEFTRAVNELSELIGPATDEVSASS